MSRTPRRTAATLSLLARLSVPFLAATGGAAAQGCLFGSPGPSTVGQGKLYVSDDPTYDQFFSELYQVQLAMGQATDRETNNRARVANALGVATTSSADQLADALDQRSVGLGKTGVVLKVRISGLEAGGTPTAALEQTGASPKPGDAALLTALATSIKDEAALIADVRHDRPRIDRAKPQADGLEPGIDVTFRKGGAHKRSEVRKNIEDAQKLIPLMTQRSADLEQRATEFLQKIQKVLGAAAAAATTPEPAAVPAAAPKTAPAPKKAGGKSKPAAPHAGGEAGEPAPPAEAPKPAAKPEAPKAKPAADDFEP